VAKFGRVYSKIGGATGTLGDGLDFARYDYKMNPIHVIGCHISCNVPTVVFGHFILSFSSKNRRKPTFFRSS